MDDSFIMTKDVDWSLLTRGFAIPAAMQEVVANHLTNGYLQHGEKREIKIVFGGQIYTAMIVSVNFNKTKFSNHKELWQILYKSDNLLLHQIKERFVKTYNVIYKFRMEKGERNTLKIPQEEREFIALYTTDVKDIFHIELFSNDNICLQIKSTNEVMVENLLNIQDLTDAEAGLVEKYHLHKIRKLNRGIGDYLKSIYNYHCQICGESIGLKYGTKIAECHHIDYFVDSLNNDMNNLLILCPNHHRIIHSLNPVFDFKDKVYRYENGYVDKLKLNVHL